MDIAIFWEGIKKLCKQHGITQRELSVKIGKSAHTIETQMFRGTVPDAHEINQIAKVFGISPGDLLINNFDGITRDIPTNAFVVPILDQELSAGNGVDLPSTDVVTGYFPVPKELSRYGEQLAALHVRGDSREPTLRSGDMVVCDSCGWDGTEGLYAIRLNGCGYVKRVQAARGTCIIRSDNPKYGSFEAPADKLELIGRVHYVIHKLD